MSVKLEVSIQQVREGMVFILFSYGSERSIPATLTVCQSKQLHEAGSRVQKAADYILGHHNKDPG